MASFSAELHVGGLVYPVLHCRFGVHQETHQRGQVSTKVRKEPVYVTVPVPDGDALPAWAADPHKRLAAAVVFKNAAGGMALETLVLKAAYCVSYQEVFVAGDARDGAYVAHLVLSDPDGFTIQAGGPGAAFVAPAAREHGAPGVAALGAVLGGAARNPDIPPHLPPPVPVPSPDHAQVHVTAAEWTALIKDRWDDSKAAKSKRFLAQHRSTEFHVENDPFTYRTDEQGRMVAVYDAQKRYSVTGSKNGLLGIPLTLNGEPTYAGTPHMFPATGAQKNVVVIDMVGNRPGDFKAANEAAGLASLVASQGRAPDRAPDGYTWHHRDDFTPQPPPNPPYGKCTMELVQTKAHEDTFVHRGSCDQCNKHNNQKLYK